MFWSLPANLRIQGTVTSALRRPEGDRAMTTGTVKWFDSKKGFGFILNAEGKDVFVHFSSIEGDGFRSLKDGDQVEYEEQRGDKGLSATVVRRIASEARPKAVGAK